jgi:sugar (pentulose or hexulose) kinase
LIDGSKGACDGIYLTGQMHGVVLTDRYGEPQGNVITWRDSLKARKATELVSSAEFITTQISDRQVYALGNELRDGLPIATLLARRTQGQKVSKCIPHSLISYCTASLTDFSRPPLMHITDAAAHGFYNVLEEMWDTEVLKVLDLHGMNLPAVTRKVVPAGDSATFGCPVYVAVGDQQAALMGANLQVGEVSLNIATGSQVSAIEHAPNPKSQVRPYFDDLYLSTFTHIPAGRALNVLVSLVTELCPVDSEQAWDTISKLTKTAVETELDIKLSFFPSLTGRFGSISNIDEDNLTVGGLFRAAVVEMVSRYHDYTECLFPKLDFSAAVVTGGLGTRFPPLMSHLEQTFGKKKIRVNDSPDASLSGLMAISQHKLT